MVRIVLILSLLGNICYADDPTFIQKDQKAPYDGHLFSEPKTNEIRVQLLERDSALEINESLKKTNEYYKQNSASKDQQITLLLERNDNLAKSLREERSTTNWERILYFGLGIVATGLAIKGVKEITH